jgi:acetylornithine/N-succinyldiaminopimelate aminotransferase
MKPQYALDELLGPSGPAIVEAMRAGRDFIDGRTTPQLLPLVGAVVDKVPAFEPIDKQALQDSCGGNQKGLPDDLLVGRGLFYLSEQRKLYLDCTSGHYQMLWGYNHPELCVLISDAMRAGVVWDNHSNIPQSPVKRLGQRLIAIANAPGETDPLDTVSLGVCTGSVACGAALKIMLKMFARTRGEHAVPVIVVLGGNYHGTDLVPQFMRGMWPGLLANLEIVSLEPNDAEALSAAFRAHGTRIAGFWAEPIMMNREAIAVSADYLQLARQLCDKAGALFCVDEIQTGFWQPQVFVYRELGLHPDLVVIGKGMTAGFHPLSGILLKQRHDVLEQYDAISTNGSAALPSLVALASLSMIEAQSSRIAAIGQRINRGFQKLAVEFSELIQAHHGNGYLSGLKFRHVETAQQFQRALLDRGLWTRVHAYHSGHRTVLTKLGLLADESVVDFMMDQFRLQMRRMAHPPTAGATANEPMIVRENGK